MLDIRDHGGAFAGKGKSIFPKVELLNNTGTFPSIETSYDRFCVAGKYMYHYQSGIKVFDLELGQYIAGYAGAYDATMKGDSFEDEVITATIQKINKDNVRVWSNSNFNGVNTYAGLFTLTKDFVYAANLSGVVLKIDRLAGQTVATGSSTFGSTDIGNASLSVSSDGKYVIYATSGSSISRYCIFNTSDLSTVVNGATTSNYSFNSLGVDIKGSTFLWFNSKSNQLYVDVYNLNANNTLTMKKTIGIGYIRTYVQQYSHVFNNYKDFTVLNTGNTSIFVRFEDSPYSPINVLTMGDRSGEFQRATDKRLASVSTLSPYAVTSLKVNL